MKINILTTLLFVYSLFSLQIAMAKEKSNSTKSDSERKIIVKSLHDESISKELDKVFKKILETEDEKLINEFLLTKKFLSRFDGKSLAAFSEKSLNASYNIWRENLLFLMAKQKSKKLDKFLFKYYFRSEKNIKGKSHQEIIKIVIEKLDSLNAYPRPAIVYGKIKYSADNRNAVILYKVPTEGEIEMKFISRTINGNIVWFPIECKIIACY